MNDQSQRSSQAHQAPARVLGRQLAQELSPAEIEQISGGMRKDRDVGGTQCEVTAYDHFGNIDDE